MPAKALSSVNLNKQPAEFQETQAEVLAAMRTRRLTFGRRALSDAGISVQVSRSQAAAQRTKLAAKAAKSSWITRPAGERTLR